MKKLAIVLSAVLFMPALGFANEEVENTMKQMQRAYKGALQSQSIAQMKPYVARLHQYADQASKASYGRTEQKRADYKDGMRELQTDLQDLDDAIAQNNLVSAKQILKAQIDATKKQAHKALNVKEEGDEHGERGEGGHTRHLSLLNGGGERDDD